MSNSVHVVMYTLYVWSTWSVCVAMYVHVIIVNHVHVHEKRCAQSKLSKCVIINIVLGLDFGRFDYHSVPRDRVADVHMYLLMCLALYTYMLSLSSPVHLVCDALVEVLWLLCIVYVIRAQPAELPR